MIKKRIRLLALPICIISFVLAPKVRAACPTLPTDKGTISVNATAPTNSTYYIWSRIKTPSASSKAYYLQIDNGCGVLVGGATLPVNTWTWVNYHDGNAAARTTAILTSGAHTFTLYGVDPNLEIDRLVLTADTNCVPAGAGDNCLNDTSTPITNVKNDSDPTASGSIQVGSANSKSTIMIDGHQVAKGEGLVTVDTSKLTDGYHTITIQTLNPDGTISTTTRRIYVKNHGHLWDRAYTHLYAAVGYRQWAAQALVLAAAAVFMSLAGILLYVFWARRLWERIPLINQIHLNFLHVPALLKRFDPAIRSTKDTSATLTPTLPSTNAVVGDMHGSFRPAKTRLAWHRYRVNVKAVVEIAVFAAVGSVLALFAVAGANSFGIELEQGNKTGVTTLTDGTASAGGAIQFGTGTVQPPPTCPSGQVGTPPNCTTPQTTFSSQCLARTGNKINITGAQSGGYRDYSVAANNIYNATGATWTGQTAWAITIEGNGPACWYGGVFQGTWNDTDPSVSWETPYHHSAAFTSRVPNLLIEGYRADNQGDGINLEGAADNFHLRALYLSNMHDDCIQNDFLHGGLIEDSLFDGCYTGISEDDFTKALNGSANTLTFQNNLMYTKAMNTVYRGTAPGVGLLFKGWYQSPSTKVVLKNNIFYATQLPGFSTNGLGVPAGMDITDCSNNIFVWTGPGSQPPGNFPSCFSFTKDVTVWNNAVAKWKADHPSIR